MKILDSKEIKPVNPTGNQPWIFIGRTDAEAKTPILWLPDAKNWLIWKDPGSGRLKAGEGDNRGWDGWMASATQWTWVWVNSGSWWWTGSPGMLQCMGSQIDTTEQMNWIELNWTEPFFTYQIGRNSSFTVYSVGKAVGKYVLSCIADGNVKYQ